MCYETKRRGREERVARGGKEYKEGREEGREEGKEGREEGREEGKGGKGGGKRRERRGRREGRSGRREGRTGRGSVSTFFVEGEHWFHAVVQSVRNGNG